MSKKLWIIGISLLFASGVFGAEAETAGRRDKKYKSEHSDIAVSKFASKEVSVKIDTIGCNNPFMTLQLFKYIIWDDDEEAFKKAGAALLFSGECVVIKKTDKLFLIQDL